MNEKIKGHYAKLMVHLQINAARLKNSTPDKFGGDFF
jgi:hypothetical protein